MQEDSHFPQEMHFSGSTFIPPLILIALRGQAFAQIPHWVQSSARSSALTAFSKVLSAPLASSAVTDTCPPPKSLALPVFILARAISNSGEYFTSPTVLRASSTYAKSLLRGTVTMASME